MARRKKIGRMLDAGRISLAPTSGAIAGTQHRGRLETRQRAVAEFEHLIAANEMLLPQPLAAIVADAARAGVRRGQGRSGAVLAPPRRSARETALAEAPRLRQLYRAQAYDEGRERSWAGRMTAEAVRRRMIELGDPNPPSVASLLKRGL